MDLHIHWVKSYGYPGLFAALMLGMFGLPVPDETILTFAGYLISRQHLDLAPALLAVYLGSICGITLNYLVGRYLGWPMLHKYGFYLRLGDDRINAAHRWFERYGKFALFIGYFFPGVRHLTAFSAGAAHLEYRHFAPYAYSGGFFWVVAFVAIGYFLGEERHWIVPLIRSYLWIALGLIFLVILIGYVGWRLRSRPKP